MSNRNTPQFLADTLHELASANISTWLFGGWAEELSGLRPPGPHGDIDLLYPAGNFRAVDEFLLAHGELEEVVGKRFVHKRAFRRQGILVELFLLRPALSNQMTDFFGLHQFHWPADTQLHMVPLLGVPVPSAMRSTWKTSRQCLTILRLRTSVVPECWWLPNSTLRD